jgi:hypothetical protein
VAAGLKRLTPHEHYLLHHLNAISSALNGAIYAVSFLENEHDHPV